MSTVARLVAAVSAHDPEAMTWCYAPGATVWPTGWPAPAPAAEWLAVAPLIFERFPDLDLHTVCLVESESRAAVELRLTGTEQPTGDPLLADGTVVFDLEGDRIVRERHYWLYDAQPGPVGDASSGQEAEAS